jgi:uncharacterized protein (DUF302 family)
MLPMYYIVDTPKPFEQAATDLEAAVKAHNFGVLHVHDLGNTLRSKGQAFTEQCKVFKVCNPGQAAKVLAADMRLNMALPCRISVFTEHGKTRSDHAGQRTQLCFLAEQQYPGIDQLACVWPENRRAQDRAVLAHHDLDHAAGL